MRVKGFVMALMAGWMSVFAGFANAVEVTNLYQTTVEVPDRSRQSLRHGSQEALAEVVIRVSGDSAALEAYDITQAMAHPDRYIEQYSYERSVKTNPETQLPEPVYKLKVAFNPRSVRQLIRHAGLPIWASNRAEVLVWLVVEDDGGRRLVNSDTAPDLVAQLSKEAARRGLPIAYPINDLQDQLAVSTGDVWGMFMDPIAKASQRYNPGALLVGKVYPPGPDGVVGAWTYQMDETQEFIETQGVTPADVMAQAINFSADKLAEKYAVVLGEGDADYVWLSVEGVENLRDFALLTEYLDELVAVKQANMDRLQDAETRFRVYLESDLENLKQLFKLDGKLIELATVKPEPGVSLTINEQQQTTITGAAVPVTDRETDEPDEPEVATIQPTIELRYHWHRTYVPKEP